MATRELALSWTRSCLASDTDFAVYAGVLPDSYDFEPITCTTAGLPEWILTPQPGDRYYIVVARNSSHEGTYGTRSTGSQRPPSAQACLPQDIRECEPAFPLLDLDSGQPDPSGDYRWMDVADQLYAIDYRESYDYTQSDVQVQVFPGGTTFQGVLTAVNLKPHFAYQVKLVGHPGTPSNEPIGLTGRWWQEEWNGSAWSNGQNLNNKGDGSSPSPNDTTYFARRDIPDATSPTGRRYKFVGYLVFDYFITDAHGAATLEFEASSSYHVLWKTTQRAHTSDDGPVKTATYDVELPDPLAAYDIDYPEATREVFGEWERLPVGVVTLPPGDYDAQFVLTEESFHGSGLAGGWAAAVGADVLFQLEPPSPPLAPNLP